MDSKIYSKTLGLLCEIYAPSVTPFRVLPLTEWVKNTNKRHVSIPVEPYKH